MSRRSVVLGGASGFCLMAGAAALPFWLGSRRRPEEGESEPIMPEPIQTHLAETAAPFTHLGWRVTPVAAYSLDAFVLLSERYRWDDLAALSPVDLALSWGMASDPRVVAQMDMIQSRRFLHWRIQLDTGLDPGAISRSSANVHIIPASPDLEEVVLDFESGDRVHLEGWLVDLEDPGGRVWKSSQTRSDVGAGACEIFFVQGARRFGET